jgi:hypothetical protein
MAKTKQEHQYTNVSAGNVGLDLRRSYRVSEVRGPYVEVSYTTKGAGTEQDEGEALDIMGLTESECMTLIELLGKARIERFSWGG